MAGAKHRPTAFTIAVYVLLPGILIAAGLGGWMIAVENATAQLESTDSPDGRYRAEIVREDPGVSSGYEYMVRLMPAGLTPLAKSLRVLPFVPVYVALDVHREPDKLMAEWTGPREVTIHCEGCSEATPGKEKWRDVAVKYELR